MILRTPRSTRTATLFPYTTPFRSRLGEKPSVVAIIVAGFVTLRAKLLPEDAEAGVLALADLRAERLPLAIGAPDPARIAAAIGSRPERDRIYAAIGLAAGDVGRAGDVGDGMMPRHAPGASAGFDRVGDRIGDESIGARGWWGW